MNYKPQGPWKGTSSISLKGQKRKLSAKKNWKMLPKLCHNKLGFQYLKVKGKINSIDLREIKQNQNYWKHSSHQPHPKCILWTVYIRKRLFASVPPPPAIINIKLADTGAIAYTKTSVRFPRIASFLEQGKRVDFMGGELSKCKCQKRASIFQTCWILWDLQIIRQCVFKVLH